MAATPNGTLEWNIEDVAKALKISPEDVKTYFTDGRRVSFILERRIANEFIKGILALSEGAGYDLMDSSGGKWEVRSITKRGIFFNPSRDVGSGRKFDEGRFLEKLNEIKGYIVCDVVRFPAIPFWIITASEVLNWWQTGKLQSNARVSRSKVLELLDLKAL